MKANKRALAIALALSAGAIRLHSQDTGSANASNGVAGPSDNIRKETTNLVLDDAQRASAPNKESAVAPVSVSPSVVTMDPYIVLQPKVPVAIMPVYETPLSRFLKTGLLYHKSTGTTRIDFGVVNTAEEHGYAAPELKLSFSW
jgi:hypothetical protein